MKHAQTIAIARELLAEGRVTDVARMIEPLLSPQPEGDTGQIVLCALMARIKLFRNGDAAHAIRLLEPYEELITQDHLDPTIRAEIALWLGWAHAWQEADAYNDARALHLFDRAERLFRKALNEHGRCWTLIGQALAYSTIDEYQLMHQAIDRATQLLETLRDAQAELWLHDLRVIGFSIHGHYDQAEHQVNTLNTLAQKVKDPLMQGRAFTHLARLSLIRGRSPETIIEAALEAEAILQRAHLQGAFAMVVARVTRIRAMIRNGAMKAARVLIDQSLSGLAHVPGASERLLLARAQLALIRTDYAGAQSVLDEMLNQMHRRQHQLLTSSIAIMRSELLSYTDDHQRALEWAERAYRNARETGHTAQQLLALLQQVRICILMDTSEQARLRFRELEAYSSFFSVLPFAAERFYLLGLLARKEDNQEEARAHLAQALSAYSLIGDVYHTATTQLELARLGISSAPARTRPLLEAALLTFNQLGACLALENAQGLLNAWPGEQDQVPETMEASIGASLARAALSVELVTESWLQAVERLLPGRWISMYRCLEGQPWERVHQHGKAPENLTFPNPSTSPHRTDQVMWTRLRGHPGPCFFFGVSIYPSSDPAWEVASTRIQPWLPVATLALDHALLRARHLNTANLVDRYDEETPEIPLDDFVYASTSMREVVQQIHRIRASHSPVLITGESGTGKELIAQAVHTTSERKKSTFLAFNCSTVPHELFDSHLFGHERGSFTGATQSHPGVIRAAEGGTLFLDEIGDLPLDVQPKLLRFLQEGEIFPLGAKRPVQVNVRIVAATNQDLEERIRLGRFREDLFYRLNVIPLRVPPLRERREEIPLLVRHFLGKLNTSSAQAATITNRAVEALLRYHWPGNVRQLRNEVERMLVYVGSEPTPLIDLKDLSPAVVKAADKATESPLSQEQLLLSGQDLEQLMAGTEKRLIETALNKTKGQVSASADMLGLTRQGLYKKMKRLGIDASQFQGTRSRTAEDSFFQLN